MMAFSISDCDAEYHAMNNGAEFDPIGNRQSKIENRNWIWFFAVLAALGTAAVAINWAYNSRQQLTLEELERNEVLWDKAGPADYDLVIEKTYQSSASDEPNTERIEVTVRQKKVVAGTLNGMPQDVAVGPWARYDMPGWFGFVERFVKMDSQPNAPRTFRTAEFDPRTGQLLRFTRSVSMTRERQAITFRLTQP